MPTDTLIYRYVRLNPKQETEKTRNSLYSSLQMLPRHRLSSLQKPPKRALATRAVYVTVMLGSKRLSAPAIGGDTELDLRQYMQTSRADHLLSFSEQDLKLRRKCQALSEPFIPFEQSSSLTFQSLSCLPQPDALQIGSFCLSTFPRQGENPAGIPCKSY